MTDNPITPLTPAQVADQEQIAANENFIVRDLVAIDDAANVLTGGKPDETISSRLARDAMEHHEDGIVGSKILDLFQKDHGADAQAGDMERAIEAEKLENSDSVLK
jgi:hypothetical protein